MVSRTAPSRTVSDAMTRDVISVHPDAPFKQVVEVLVGGGIDAAPVVDERGTLLGVVSGSDLTCHEERTPSIASLLVGGRPARTHARKARGRTARDLMTSPARTVSPGAPVCDALAEMQRGGVGRLVVQEHGRVVGVLTRSDLLRVFLRPDDELQADVSAAVRAVEGAEDVRVTVGDGVAHLRGHVRAASTAYACADAAGGVLGLVDVEDELTHEVDDHVPMLGYSGV